MNKYPIKLHPAMVSLSNGEAGGHVISAQRSNAMRIFVEVNLSAYQRPQGHRLRRAVFGGVAALLEGEVDEVRKRFPSRKECVRWPGNDEASEEWAHAAQGAMGNYEHAAPEPPSCARPLQVECAADGRGRKGQCQGRRGREGQCRKGQRQSTRALRCRPNTKARNRPKPRAPPLRERCDGARRHRRVRVASRRVAMRVAPRREESGDPSASSACAENSKKAACPSRRWPMQAAWRPRRACSGRPAFVAAVTASGLEGYSPVLDRRGDIGGVGESGRLTRRRPRGGRPAARRSWVYQRGVPTARAARKGVSYNSGRDRRSFAFAPAGRFSIPKYLFTFVIMS